MTTILPLEAQQNSPTTGEFLTSQDMLPVLHRLQQLLPLEKRQQALVPPLRMVHRAILQSLAATGKPPAQAEIAAMLGSRLSALHALAVLGRNDLVILSAPVTQDDKTKQLRVTEGVEVVGAYPMTTESTPHRVVLGGHTVNAMCAVDALAVAPMFGLPTWIESRCHATEAPIRIFQHGGQILEASPSPEVRVGIRWQSAGACAAHTLCAEMVFLRDEQAARGWRNAQTTQVDIFTLPEAIELGSAFFLPLIEG